jgi:hypothetical protein
MASISRIPAWQKLLEEEEFSGEAPVPKPFVIRDEHCRHRISEDGDGEVTATLATGTTADSDMPPPTWPPHELLSDLLKDIGGAEHIQILEGVEALEAPMMERSGSISSSDSSEITASPSSSPSPPPPPKWQVRSNPPLPEPGNDFTLEESLPDHYRIDPEGRPKPYIVPSKGRLDSTRLIEHHSGKLSSKWLGAQLQAISEERMQHSWNF